MNINAIYLRAFEAEWNSCAALLPAVWRNGVSCPGFQVSPTLKCWGQWQGGERACITLCERLLVRHPWYAVRDVLRHEIAHQFVEQCGLGKEEKPHGPAFREMCARIGARPDASGSYPVLDEVIFSDDDGQGEQADTPQARMLVKIRKLLALSRSSDQHEAEAALLKAREMADKYDLEAVESGSAVSDEDFFRISLGVPKIRAQYEDTMIAGILKEFYRVMPIWEFVPDEENEGGFLHQLAICGTRRNLRIASYVYDCISSYMERAARELPMELFCKVMRGKKAMEDFRIGILQGFRTALQGQPEPEQVRALVLAGQTKLNDFFQRMYPRLNKMRRSHRVRDYEMVRAGDEAGRRLRIHPGVEKGDRGRRMLGTGEAE